MTQPYEVPQTPASAVVQITLGEVFNEVRAMHQELRDLNSSLSPVKAQVADHETRLRLVDGLPDDFKKLEKTVTETVVPQLTKLETRIAKYAGAAGVLGAGAGYLASWVIYHH